MCSTQTDYSQPARGTTVAGVGGWLARRNIADHHDEDVLKEIADLGKLGKGKLDVEFVRKTEIFL